MDKEAFDRFAETIAKRAYVIAHPDTFIDFRRNLPRMMAAMDRLVEATRGQYLPYKGCRPGDLFALPFKKLDFPLPKIDDDFKKPFDFSERFVIAPRRFVTWAL